MAPKSPGFTLIEVMIAVVILAVGLSSLFTSEAGAVRIAQRARTTTIATLLARCKMGEIEERVSKEGFPLEQIDGRDECCEGAEHDGFECEWKVERIVLPELDESGDTGGATLGGGSTALGGGATLGAGGAGLASKSPLSSAPQASALADAGAGGDGGILGNVMTSMGSSSMGESDPIAAMAMQLTFPIMKPVIEEQVRRATVSIKWKEGDSEQTFDVVQYLVNELPLLPSEDATENLQNAVSGGGSSTGSGTTGTGSAPTPSTPSPGAGGRP